MSISLDDIVFGEEIGQNSNGQVFKAKWLCKDVAVKKIKIYPETNHEREYKHLSRANHENIVFLHGTAIKDCTLYLVMEFVDGESLHDFLFTKKINYDLAHVINWALQIAKGIGYMHKQGVIHRDLNPNNILLCNSRRNLKICNFTFARTLNTLMTHNVGTRSYMAPEVMIDDENYTEKCDVYSFAISLWEMLSRKKAFENYSSTVEKCKDVQAGKRPSLEELKISCPENITKLLTDGWARNPKERPSMDDIIRVLSLYPIVIEQLSL